MSHFDCLIVGCGYLGGRVAARWREAGLRVAVSTRSPTRAEQLQAEGYTPFVADVLQPESLAQLPAAQVLLHAVGFDRNSGQSQRAVYVEGFQNLLTALQGRVEKCVHISSTSVYGQNKEEEVDEDSPTKPSRENGKMVLEAEQLLLNADIPGVILRLAGIYGPNRLLARIQQTRTTTPIPGNPDAWLNLIHVDDCVAAVEQAARLSLPRQTILVADDRPLRRREYYTTLAKLLQAPPPVFQPEQPDPKGDRGLGKRCRNARLHQLLLPELHYPSIESGLPAALQHEN